MDVPAQIRPQTLLVDEAIRNSTQASQPAKPAGFPATARDTFDTRRGRRRARHGCGSVAPRSGFARPHVSCICIDLGSA
eukprot:4989816-Prymnesium_polylepis.1